MGSIWSRREKIKLIKMKLINKYQKRLPDENIGKWVCYDSVEIKVEYTAVYIKHWHANNQTYSSYPKVLDQLEKDQLKTNWRSIEDQMKTN